MEKKFRMAWNEEGRVDKWRWRESEGHLSATAGNVLFVLKTGKTISWSVSPSRTMPRAHCRDSSEGSGDHRAVWQPSGWRMMGLVAQGSGQVWNVMERRGDFLCEGWGEGVNDEAHAWELDGWCGWGEPRRGAVWRRRMRSLLWPLGLQVFEKHCDVPPHNSPVSS